MAKLETYTVKQLKQVCKDKKIKGYSNLKKKDLIKLCKKQSGGFLGLSKKIPVKNIKNPSYSKMKLTKLQKYSLSEINKVAKRESPKYEEKTYQKFLVQYKKLTKSIFKSKKMSDSQYRKVFKEYIDNIKNNPILMIHFPKRNFDVIYNSGKLINSFEQQQLRGEKSTVFYNEDEDIWIDPKKMTDAEKDVRFEHSRLYTEHKLFRYPFETDVGADAPIYGCLNIAKRSSGCADSYGKFVIKLYTNDDIRNRISLTAKDSLYQLDDFKNAPDIVGTLNHFYHVLYFTSPNLFKNSIKSFVNNRGEYRKLSENPYLEFQIHGSSLDLKNNVSQLFHKSKDKKLATKFCKKFDCEAVQY